MLGDGLLKVNQFVSITDENLMHGVGEYLVGTDIPAGEYYFWGSTFGLQLFPKASAVIQNSRMMLILQSKVGIL